MVKYVIITMIKYLFKGGKIMPLSIKKSNFSPALLCAAYTMK